MAKTEKIDKIWVTSATGKPVHLVDKSLKAKDSDELIRVSITQRMVDEGIGVEVPATDFFKHKITIENILVELPNKAEAKKKFDDFIKKVRAEQKEREKELDAIDQLAKEVGQDVEARIKELLKEESKSKNVERGA